MKKLQTRVQETAADFTTSRALLCGLEPGGGAEVSHQFGDVGAELAHRDVDRAGRCLVGVVAGQGLQDLLFDG
jgi:hypothetical protein